MKKLKKAAVLTLIASLVLSISAQGNKTTITAKKSSANVRTVKFKGTGKRLKKDSFYWYKHVIETNGEDLNRNRKTIKTPERNKIPIKTGRCCYSKQKEISDGNVYNFEQKSSICFKKRASEGTKKRNCHNPCSVQGKSKEKGKHPCYRNSRCAGSKDCPQPHQTYRL